MTPAARTLIGVALGPGTVAAVELAATPRGARPARSWTIPVDSTSADGLSTALATLRAEIGAGRVVAGVALLRPWAQVKAIPVPRVRRSALRDTLARDVRRWFIAGDEPMISDAGAVRRGAAASASAVCGGTTTVERVVSELQAAGFEVDRVTGAAVALELAVRALVPDAARGGALIVARGVGWSELIALHDGALRIAQVAPPSDDEMADCLSRLRARGPTADRVVLLDAPMVPAYAALRLLPLPAPLPAAAVVAFGAALAGQREPLLLPPALRDARARRARRRTVRVLVAAAVAFLSAVGMHRAGLARDLAAVERSRTAIAPDVERAMEMRRRVERSRALLETMSHAAQGGSHWTRVLAAVAGALPDSAYLNSVVAEGSEIRISGVAVSAQAAVPAFEASPWLSGVWLSAPIRRDDADGMEHFELTATVSTRVDE